MNKLISLAMVLFLFASCAKKEPVVCIDEVCIDGEWEWVSSSGSIAGITITPESELETRKVSIGLGVYREYVNSELILENEYDYITRDDSTVPGFEGRFLVLKEGMRFYVDEGSSNKLVLAESCGDCWTHTYERE